MIAFVDVAIAVIKTIFAVVWPIVKFLAGVAWSIILKLTPLFVHELTNIGRYVFSQAQASEQAILTKFDVKSKLTVIKNDIVSHIKTFASTLDTQEIIALVGAPLVFIAVIILHFF